ncbi:MAG: MarR family transcriptional regulator [Ignavibacteriales bacterium]|jgi:DNA-binding MarR family transcriptional regulator|nr:MarR family transcriptional regulator [Ignavibacteriales bacterium]
MKLEEEIKQSKFRNEYHKLAVNIFYTYSWLLNLQTQLFKKFKITSNQYNILRILRGQHPNPATINLLKDRMIDKMSDASRLVERLRKKGLVKRELCKNDRRRVDVVITDKGLKLLSDIDKLNDEYDSFFKNLSVTESKTLNDLLDKLRG